ncbi:hypothetical protein KJ766_01885, partial [Patescibacteria group bacterium]|nr:hypothetical protein [Patescibacteria group bacterium]
GKINLLIKNDVNQSTIYKFDVLRGQVDLESNEMILAEDDGIADWIKFENTIIEIPAFESGILNADILVPQDVVDGLYIIAIIESEIKENTEEVSVNTGFASLVFLQVGEDLTKNVSVLNFDYKPRITNKLPIHFFATMRNEGESLSVPAGFVRIKNIFGTLVTVVSLNTNGNRLVSGQTRTFSGQWGESDGKEGFLSEVKNEISYFTIGLFKIEPVVIPFENEAIELESYWIVVFPWRVISIVFIILLFALGLLYWLRQRV